MCVCREGSGETKEYSGEFVPYGVGVDLFITCMQSSLKKWLHYRKKI